LKLAREKTGLKRIEKMKKWLTLFLFAFWAQLSFSQAGEDLPDDDAVPRPPIHLKKVAVGGMIYSGTSQFFDSYTREVMYLNAQSGLLLYQDWDVYSAYTVTPVYKGAGGFISFADSARKFRVRLAATFSQRNDSMAYRSGFAVNDTIYGRDGHEVTRFVGVNAGFFKYTRPVLKFLRFHCGADVEAGLAATSKIVFYEFAYDYGDQVIVELDEFHAPGRLRLNLYFGAMIGTEILLGPHLALSAEVRTGVGLHWIPKEKPLGISRNNWIVGTAWYF
jgi:hypothetical protein